MAETQSWVLLGALSASTEGTGVFGIATAVAGFTHGVHGQTISPDGYAGYFEGRGYFSGNVGVGTTSPENALHVNKGSAGLITGNINAPLIVESNFPAYINILAPDASEKGILFGKPSEGSTSGGIIYDTPTTPDGLQFRTNNLSNRMVIDAGGNVGIGTTNPEVKLDVVGEAMFRETAADPKQIRITPANADGAGQIVLFGPNGGYNVRLGNNSTVPNNGMVTVNDASGNTQANMAVDTAGNGVVTADVKNFCEPNPDDSSTDIVYACIEGPEAAMYVRGTSLLVNGRAWIDLPDHFRALAVEAGMTVQLTPRSAQSKGLAAVHVALDGIEVAELLNGTGNYEFDWRVEAVRKGYEDYRVIRPWDEMLSGDTDRDQAWQARLRSISSRRDGLR